jgi:hypothetical protein
MRGQIIRVGAFAALLYATRASAFAPTTKVELESALGAVNADATTALAGYGAVGTWDVTRITSFYALSTALGNFNEDLTGWDTSAVSTMGSMFHYATSFNGAVAFDTSSVTAMTSMFYFAAAFNRPCSWDTTSVMDMQTMLAYANDFNQPLSNLDTASVTSFATMFTGGSYNQPIAFDSSSATSVSAMFSQAATFDRPLGTLDTARVTTMANVFLNAAAFNQALAFDTTSVTTMARMFEGAVLFNQPLAFDTCTPARAEPALCRPPRLARARARQPGGGTLLSWHSIA